MSRDWRLYWEDMIEAAEKVKRYTKGMSAKTFTADEKTRDAVLRNLEIIGEAAKQIPLETRQRARGVDCARSRDSGTLSLMPILESTTSSYGTSS